jgi:hypothetical protein
MITTLTEESNHLMKEIKFDLKESFEIQSNKQNFLLNISLNEKLIFFEIEEKKNIFPKEEYSIYLNLEELGKINKYFLQFDSLKEVFDSLKMLIKKKNLDIIKEEKQMKIKIINPGNDKEFFINVLLKEKDIKSEINSILSYITSLNEKVNNLETKMNEIYAYIDEIKQLRINKPLNYKLFRSSIINKTEISSFLSWLENKPKEIRLLLDSNIDGDLTETFYKKCSGKSPTIVLVKTTKGYRFGAYSTIPWNNQKNNFSSSSKNFIFSLDKNKKYSILKSGFAIQTNDDYFGFFDFYIYNNCTSVNKNFVNNASYYDTTEKYEINFGNQSFTVLSYEVYHIIY